MRLGAGGEISRASAYEHSTRHHIRIDFRVKVRDAVAFGSFFSIRWNFGFAANNGGTGFRGNPTGTALAIHVEGSVLEQTIMTNIGNWQSLRYDIYQNPGTFEGNMIMVHGDNEDGLGWQFLGVGITANLTDIQQPLGEAQIVLAGGSNQVDVDFVRITTRDITDDIMLWVRGPNGDIINISEVGTDVDYADFPIVVDDTINILEFGNAGLDPMNLTPLFDDITIVENVVAGTVLVVDDPFDTISIVDEGGIVEFVDPVDPIVDDDISIAEFIETLDIFTVIIQSDCSSLTGWNDASFGSTIIEVDPAGQFHLVAELPFGQVQLDRFGATEGGHHQYTITARMIIDNLGNTASDSYQMRFGNTTQVPLAMNDSEIRIGSFPDTRVYPTPPPIGTWFDLKIVVTSSLFGNDADDGMIEVYIDDVLQGTGPAGTINSPGYIRFIIRNGSQENDMHIDDILVYYSDGEGDEPIYRKDTVGIEENVTLGVV
jgi:hypothetical protein